MTAGEAHKAVEAPCGLSRGQVEALTEAAYGDDLQVTRAERRQVGHKFRVLAAGTTAPELASALVAIADHLDADVPLMVDHLCEPTSGHHHGRPLRTDPLPHSGDPARLLARILDELAAVTMADAR
jgi:hypothetical protein